MEQQQYAVPNLNFNYTPYYQNSNQITNGQTQGLNSSNFNYPNPAIKQ
jgi:hypothetical protein